MERPEGAPPVPEADERVARAGRRRRVHQAAARSRSFPTSGSPRTSCPGRPLFFASAIPFSGVAQPVLVESHMGRPTKIEGNPEHPASLGATDTFTQAAILGLYDPDRAKTVTHRGEVASWGGFLGAMQSVVSRQKAQAGSGPPLPDRPDHLAVAGGADGDDPGGISRRRSGTSTIPSRATARARRRQRAGSEPVYHFDKADVVVSLDADFLTCGPGSVRYQKDFAAPRRVTRRAQGDEPALRRREHADADRRQGGPPPRAEGGRGRRRSRVQLAGGARRRRRRAARQRRAAAAGAPDARSGSPRSPRICRRTADARSSSPASTSPPPSTRSRRR